MLGQISEFIHPKISIHAPEILPLLLQYLDRVLDSRHPHRGHAGRVDVTLLSFIILIVPPAGVAEPEHVHYRHPGATKRSPISWTTRTTT